MPKQHLHYAQIGPIIEQVSGKRMAQYVRREFFHINSCNDRIVFNAMPEGLPGHLLTAATGENDIRRLLPQQ